MMILPVHHRNVGISAQCLTEGQPAEPRAQDHHLWAALFQWCVASFRFLFSVKVNAAEFMQ
jgi:hypothetical protein